jgi:hypothetical protein
MDIPGQFFLDILHVDFHGPFEKMMTMWCKEYKNENQMNGGFLYDQINAFDMWDQEYSNL